MIITVIALIGALIDPQGLAEQAASVARDSQALTVSDLARLTAGEGSVTISTAQLDGASTGSSLTQSGAAGNVFTTGGIAIESASAGFSGLQTLSLNTGFASVSQASVSVAAGSVLFRGAEAAAPQ